MIQRIGAGARMSKAVVNGGVVYISGQVADKAAGGSVADQTRDVLEQIDDLLKQAGSDRGKLVMANVWLADIRTFGDMNGVWDAWVQPGATPARATVEAKLAGPQYSVEISIIASI